MPRIQPGQLFLGLQKKEAITVVDVRPKAAFDQAHIPGALHIPLEQIEERTGELDGNITIVFYCTSPNRSMSLEAAMTLYKLGFTKIAILNGGLQMWYAGGYPIEGQILTPTPGFVPPGTITPLVTVTPVPTTQTAATATSTATAMTTATPSPTKSLEATPTATRTKTD